MNFSTTNISIITELENFKQSIIKKTAIYRLIKNLYPTKSHYKIRQIFLELIEKDIIVEINKNLYSFTQNNKYNNTSGLVEWI